jgi:hypothetical protein
MLPVKAASPPAVDRAFFSFSKKRWPGRIRDFGCGRSPLSWAFPKLDSPLLVALERRGYLQRNEAPAATGPPGEDRFAPRQRAGLKEAWRCVKSATRFSPRSCTRN